MAQDPLQIKYDDLLCKAGFLNLQYTVRIRPAEKGSLYLSEITRITLQDLRRIIICSVREYIDPEDAIKKEMESYLKSCGAICGILILPSQILLVFMDKDLTYKWEPDNKNLNRTLSSEITPCTAEFFQKIEEYLEKVYRVIQKVYFREFGERETKKRRLQILSSIIEVLILNMCKQHDIILTKLPDSSLVNQLISFACEVPYSTPDLKNETGTDTSAKEVMLNAGLNIPVPEEVKISWLDPLLLTKILSLVLEKDKREPQRKKRTEDIPDSIKRESTLSLKLFNGVLDKISKKYCAMPTVIDPACNIGESLLLLLRYYDKGPDELILRHDTVSKRIYGAEPSSDRLMITRFGLVLSIIDSSFDDKALIQQDPSDGISLIRGHITTGSCIISENTAYDCISELERRKAMSILTPLPEDWFFETSDSPNIIITNPQNRVYESEPAIKDYVCRNYSSYSEEIGYSLLVAEYVFNQTSFPAYVFLNENWLSEARAARFRKMLKKSRIQEIMYIESVPDYLADISSSVLIGSEYSDGIIIKVSNQAGAWRSHLQIRKDLPESDGWNLKDPVRSRLMDLIKTDSVSLYDYCLGEMYHPGESYNFSKEEYWISIILEGDTLNTAGCGRPDPDARAIIKGPDQFLEGILISSLMQWYLRHLISKLELDNPFRLLAGLPIRQPDWYESGDSSTVGIITKCINKRSYLLNLLNLCRYDHDRKRIQKGLVQVMMDLDNAIFSLYRIPEDLHERLRY